MIRKVNIIISATIILALLWIGYSILEVAVNNSCHLGIDNSLNFFRVIFGK